MKPLWSRGCRSLILLAIALCPVGVMLSSPVRAQAPIVDSALSARVIVTYRGDSALLRDHDVRGLHEPELARAAFQRRADVLAASAGVGLKAGRAVGQRSHVVWARGLSSRALAERLARHPDVASVEVDQRRRALFVPNDPLFAAGPSSGLGPAVGQWYLRAPSAELLSAAHVQGAWSITRGSASIVVAVLDTGVLPQHPDLQGQLVAGYDFISEAPTANDGDGRDADPSDPGDWITPAEANDPSTPFYGASCTSRDPGTGRYEGTNSSWHGTHVASIIAAATDNAQGMAGIAHGARVMAARVLGKCGGYDSDIQAAMYWAAGIDQPGLPGSPTPARVLNVSLGSEGQCTARYQEVVNALTAKGVVVVAAAGNGAGRAVNVPANCTGVLAVLGLRHLGTKVGFSDLGPEVAIAAPGGNCVNIEPGQPCLYPILSATNTAARSPDPGGYTYSNSYDITVGTSFAVPIVAGTVALMLSANPRLTTADVRSVLQSTARAFPTSGSEASTAVCRPPGTTDQLECYCTTSLCGAGMLDAQAAVAAAQASPTANIEVLTATPTVGVPVQLSGLSSVAPAGRRLVSFQWSLVQGAGVVSGFTSATNTAQAAFEATGAANVVVSLLVTDDLGNSGRSERTITIAAAPTPPAPTAPKSGGGSWSAAWLAALGVVVLALRRGRNSAER